MSHLICAQYEKAQGIKPRLHLLFDPEDKHTPSHLRDALQAVENTLKEEWQLKGQTHTEQLERRFEALQSELRSQRAELSKAYSNHEAELKKLKADHADELRTVVEKAVHDEQQRVSRLTAEHSRSQPARQTRDDKDDKKD